MCSNEHKLLDIRINEFLIIMKNIVVITVIKMTMK